MGTSGAIENDDLLGAALAIKGKHLMKISHTSRIPAGFHLDDYLSGEQRVL